MMRKAICLLAALTLTSVACADVLYWQVNTSDSGMTEAMQAYSYAKIYYSSDGGATKTEISSYLDPSDTAPATTVYATEMADANGFYANLTGLSGDYTGYSFAIEIFNDSGVAMGHVGWESASSLQSAIISQAEFNANWESMSSGFGATGWKAGAAVPEPTSGLLLLLGAAVLGLRRKKLA